MSMASWAGPTAVVPLVQLTDRERKEFAKTSATIAEKPWSMDKAAKYLTSLVEPDNCQPRPPPCIEWVASSKPAEELRPLNDVSSLGPGDVGFADKQAAHVQVNPAAAKAQAKAKAMAAGSAAASSGSQQPGALADAADAAPARVSPRPKGWPKGVPRKAASSELGTNSPKAAPKPKGRPRKRPACDMTPHPKHDDHGDDDRHDEPDDAQAGTAGGPPPPPARPLPDRLPPPPPPGWPAFMGMWPPSGPSDLSERKTDDNGEDNGSGDETTAQDNDGKGGGGDEDSQEFPWPAPGQRQDSVGSQPGYPRRGRGRHAVPPLPPHMATLTLGCSKCRFTSNGCWVCRKRIGVALTEDSKYMKYKYIYIYRYDSIYNMSNGGIQI